VRFKLSVSEVFPLFSRREERAGERRGVRFRFSKKPFSPAPLQLSLYLFLAGRERSQSNRD